MKFYLIASMTVMVLNSSIAEGGGAETVRCSVQLTVTSTLTMPNVPMDPTVDFAKLIVQAGLKGVLDPDSIRVVDLANDRVVPHALAEDFNYGQRGRVQWVIEEPTHTAYAIRFNVVPKRGFRQSVEFTPPIGVGDLLRYNAGVPRPLTLIHPSRLVDLTGDGMPDLVGCWNYAHHPGAPWGGIFCYPRVGSVDRFEFGPLQRVRYLEDESSSTFHHFSNNYMHADFADLNGDGLIDLIYSPQSGNQIHLYLNAGCRDTGGMPVFVAHGSLPRPTGVWHPVRAVDLNGDKAIDIVVGGKYLKNTNRNRWPIELAAPVTLDVGKDACFYDVDADGLLDAVCLIDGLGDEPRSRRVAWRRNKGGDAPTFALPETLTEIDVDWCTSICAVSNGQSRELLVGHDVWQSISFFKQVHAKNGKSKFTRYGEAKSKSAIISLSDQAWPCVCDWDGDGDFDLLVGGGYGWPQIVINEGSNQRPAYANRKPILSEGKPIRILRDDVLGGRHWHNMGYLYPVFVDWDSDGLPDLLLPNETNRIFWYKNIGTRKEPKFGKQQQVLCDGYPDSRALRELSTKRSADKSISNQPYPYEKERPFFWRTGAAFADFNGDGLTDLVTHDGFTRKATLFVQYRDSKGSLRLRKQRTLQLDDGRLIDDSIVKRRSHWTESFRACDWDSDGLVDLIYSCAGAHNGIQDGGSIYLLRNCGTREDPKFEMPVTMRCFGKPIRVTNHGPSAWAGDFNGDGNPDLLTCVEWSVYPFYSHAAIEMKQRPSYQLGNVVVTK